MRAKTEDVFKNYLETNHLWSDVATEWIIKNKAYINNIQK